MKFNANDLKLLYQVPICHLTDEQAQNLLSLLSVIRSATNGMLPKEWIERFVVAQAKRLIETNPDLSFKKIAMDLGFTEHSSFYRYFRRVTGIYPQAYKEQIGTIHTNNVEGP